jgi:hypothetical protein
LSLREQFTNILQAGNETIPGLFFLCGFMRILLSIFLIITVSFYILPVKHFLKETSCTLVENPEDQKKESKKKDSDSEFYISYSSHLVREVESISPVVISQGKIQCPLLFNEAPPPDHFQATYISAI